MKLSRPSEYVNILIQDMLKGVQIATEKLYYERYHNVCSLHESQERYNACFERIEEIKKEIISICEASNEI
jgi:septin family protein